MCTRTCGRRAVYIRQRSGSIWRIWHTASQQRATLKARRPMCLNTPTLLKPATYIGPRVYTTGPGVFSASGLDDKDATRNYIKRYKEAYHTTTLKEYVVGDRIVRQWVAMACKEFGITSTTEGALDMKLDLTQMADGFSGNEHALPIHPLYNDVVQFVAKTGTFYTPTILVAYGAPWSENYWFENTDVHGNQKLRRFIPHALLDTMVKRRGQWFREDEYGHKAISKAAADIVHAGGRVCLGGHGQTAGTRMSLGNLESAIGRDDSASKLCARRRSTAPRRSGCKKMWAR